MKSPFSEIKKGHILISDGAWGTELHKRGLKPGECPENWNLTHHDDVYAIAKGYIDAGSDIILTNSFGANPIKLKNYNLEEKVVELNRAAAMISREAAGDTHFVFGSMGPTGLMLCTGDGSEDEVYEGYCIQAKALAEGGVDALCIETMSDPVEASLAIKAAKASTSCEVACTFVFNKSLSGDFHTMMGLSVDDAMNIARGAGADIIGSNCGNGIDGMVEIVGLIRKQDNSTPILVQANAGLPIFKDGETIFRETPEQMAGKAADLINAGANIIGGCCGTNSEHIRALAKAVRKI
ncbi:MAG: homocysteine S-methyltransferase family protein [Deltaproteobacteria bacterium]|nr:homocysteine S-methyltransferase family protein [Deltaproteobacteria bacterium]